MAVLMNKDSRVLIQGFGGAGQREAKTSIAYGTQVVAGVTPGRGGQTIEGVPIYNTVEEAVAAHQANVSLIFVPAPFAADAILEAERAGVPLIICITEGIPTRDMVAVKRYLMQDGIAPDRIETIGYAATRPTASNQTEVVRRLNRRIEFVILTK